MVYVKVDDHGGFDNALREFVKKLKDAKIQDKLNDLRFAKKPSEIKREEKKRTKLKIKIANRNQ